MAINLNDMPKLGFGLMRLPEKDGAIDMEQVNSMVDHYMKMDKRYFDTAYVYHGGKNEIDPEMPVILEHLNTDDDYLKYLGYLKEELNGLYKTF